MHQHLCNCFILYICRLVQHITYKEGQKLPFDEMYQKWVKDAAHEPESKKAVALCVKQLFPHAKTCTQRWGKSRRTAYVNICFSERPIEKKTETLLVGGCTLIPTSYIKDGQNIFFKLKAGQVYLGDQKINLMDIGVGLNTSFSNLLYVLSTAKLCRGADCGNTRSATLWKSTISTETFHGTPSKFCKRVLSPNQTLCSSCKYHKQYLKGNKENEENIPPNDAAPPATATACNVDDQTSDLNISRSKEEMISELEALLKELGLPEERAAVTLDSAKNEATDKTQRRWSNELVFSFNIENCSIDNCILL